MTVRDIPDEVMGSQLRSYPVVGLQLREDGDGRTVVGRAVPYGDTVDIPGGRERFVAGAFATQIGAGPGTFGHVKLYPSHDAGLSREVTRAVGKTVGLTERPDGLYAEWRMHDTTAGNDALALVRAGEVAGLSVAFRALPGGTKRGADGAYERHRVHLDHVALTDEPAYPGAQVMAIRSAAHPVAAYRRELLVARGILDSLITAG